MTNTHDLDGLRVAIIVNNNFEESEMSEPREALDNAGAETVLIAPNPDWVRSFKHDSPGQNYEVDMLLADANPDEFDAVMLPGGALNADKLRVEPKVLEFLRRFDRDNKPIAFICHAPWMLISAGITRNRNMTGYHTIKDDIVNSGAKYEDTEVLRDRNFVSSRQPSDIPAFNKKMIELFSEHIPAHA
jgi:protease I